MFVIPGITKKVGEFPRCVTVLWRNSWTVFALFVEVFAFFSPILWAHDWTDPNRMLSIKLNWCTKCTVRTFVNEIECLGLKRLKHILSSNWTKLISAILTLIWSNRHCRTLTKYLYFSKKIADGYGSEASLEKILYVRLSIDGNF